MAAYFDFLSAYDNVRINVLIEKLKRIKCPKRNRRYIQ